MAAIITADQIGKKYTIRHKQQANQDSLREALAQGLGSLAKRLLPLRGGQPSSDLPKQEDFWALRDVSFEVEQGDRLGIIGHNGAGKSTLLKILSRITEPTTGQVRVRGRVASLLEVGTGFHPELTGRENIYLNGAILGMSRHEIRRKFDEIVAFAEVERFLDTPVKRYSSGMYVRLAFAVAAHLEPEILIVDEVLAVGDAQFQAKCVGKMKQVASTGRTILLVSHNMGVIGSFCDKVVLLESGRVKAIGNTTEVSGLYTLATRSTISEGSLIAHYPAMGNEYFTPDTIKLYCEGRQSNVMAMGGTLQISLGYYRGTPSKYLKIGFHIVDQNGILVAVLSPNQQHPDFVDTLTSKGVLVCVADRMNLIPGIYSITLQFEVPGIVSQQSLENVASLTVVEADVYLSGVIPSKTHGMVYFPAQWEFLVQ